jgi:Insertion element 4 transposase N-terminal/Transposase DDE domain
MFRIGTEAVALSRAQQLSALYRIIPRDQVKRILKKTNGHCRICQRLPNLFMVYFVLAMGLFCTDCYRQVFRWLEPWKKGRVPGRSTLCEARSRLSPRPLVKLAQEVVKLLATSSTTGAFYRGMRLMGIDGFVMNIPDTQVNDTVFGRPAGSRGDGAFPQVRIVALCEVGTHVIWRWLIKPLHVAEQTMADYLLGFLQPDMLLMWDRNFFSYARVAAVISTKAQLLARVRKGLFFRPIRTLCDGSYLAKIYANKTDRRHDRYGIVVRVLDYTLDDKTRTGHKEKHHLITTLLDAQLDPAHTVIPLYHLRWEEELTIDELKTHQTQRPVLRSQTPAGVVQELYALLLDHYVVRSLMFQAALEAKTDPLSISFVGTLKILRCRIGACPRGKAAQRRWWRNLVQEVAEEVLPPRRNRINPRVIKRKMSKWKKKRPRHRDSPQPIRPFADTIIVVR